MKSGIAKQLIAASMMGGMNAAMDLKTVRPDAKPTTGTMSRKNWLKRKSKLSISKASRKANRG